MNCFLYIVSSDICIVPACRTHVLLFFFFNDTATTEIYTLSLHDALPILEPGALAHSGGAHQRARCGVGEDRKSTRLNSSHHSISYAVFCLKKKKGKMCAPGGEQGRDENARRRSSSRSA